MQSKRQSKRIARVIAAALLATTFVLTPRSYWLLYNHTPSVPVGFYQRVGGDIERGDVIAFPLPAEAHDYARKRGDSTDVLLLKPVLAVAGDHVSTLGGELRINGQLIGPIADTDSSGRTLPQWRASRTLNDGEVFVGSTRIERSFDSRFFGPVDLADVAGEYRLVLKTSTLRAMLRAAATPIHASPLGFFGSAERESGKN